MPRSGEKLTGALRPKPQWTSFRGKGLGLAADKQTSGRNAAAFNRCEFNDGAEFVGPSYAKFNGARFNMGAWFGPKPAPNMTAKFNSSWFDRGRKFA